MGIVQKKVLWYPSENPTGNPTDISNDVKSLIVKRAKDIKSNQFTIKLRNPKRKPEGIVYGKYINPLNGELLIQNDDLIKIWIKRNQDGSDFSDTDYVMTGKVKQPQVGLSESKTDFGIQGVDNSYVLLNKIFPKSYPSQAIYQTVIDIVQDLADGTTGEIDSSDPTSYDIDAQASGSSLPDDINKKYVISKRKATAEDGSVNADLNFPSKEVPNYIKPAYTYLSMISSPEYTNTDDELTGANSKKIIYSRQFLWWIDEFNRFHWFYPDDVVDDTITVGTTQSLRSYKLKKKQFESFNLVFWNAGLDDSDVAMKGYVFNNNTKLTDLKIKFLPFLQIGKTYRDEKGLTGTTLTDAVKKDVVANIKTLFTQVAKDKWKGNITEFGIKRNVGDKITLLDTWKGVNSPLRITGVTYNLNNKSLITQIDVEEDEDKLISIVSG